MRVGICVRVSPPEQNPALQVQELEDYAGRPGPDQLMADARCEKFEAVLVWKLDRFGRSLLDCLSNIQALESYGVQFIAVTQGRDTDQRNPASKFLLQVLGAAA